MDAGEREIGLVVEGLGAHGDAASVPLEPHPAELRPPDRRERAADFKQRFNPFVFKMDVGLLDGRDGPALRSRLPSPAVILLLAVEGRQG